MSDELRLLCWPFHNGLRNVSMGKGASRLASDGPLNSGIEASGWRLSREEIEPAEESDAEIARGLTMPIYVYPVFENAIRIARGETVEEHQVRVSEMWARFSEVASSNPHAWDTTAHSAEEIRSVSPRNRMVGWPYPKLMNSNNNVEQGAAVIMCSAAAAERLRTRAARGRRLQ